MMQSFADRDTAELFYSERSQRFASVARVALRKLIQINRALVLSDLAVPPGNRLEPLRGALSFAEENPGRNKSPSLTIIDGSPASM